MRAKAKYPAIAKEIRSRISSGVYTGMLPGASRLAVEFKVTPMTANRALKILENEGVVQREASKGTVINPDKNKPKALFYNEIFPLDPESLFQDLNIKTVVFNGPNWHCIKYIDYISTQKNIDFISIHEGIIPALAEKKLLRPLDHIWEYFKNIKKIDFHPKLLDMLSYKGSLYALPATYTPTMVFYNKKIFDQMNIKYPEKNWNWKDFEKLCSILTLNEDKNHVKTYGILANFTCLNVFMPFIFQNKGKIFSGEELAPDSNALVALRFLRKLKLKGFCPPYNPSESFPVRKLFSAGHASMLIGNFKDYLAIKEESCFDIGITQLPGSKQNATSLSVQGWGISQASFATPSTIEHFYQKALAFEMLESCKRIPAFQNEHFNIPKEFMDALELAKRSWDSPARFLLPELNEKMLFFWLGVSPENKTKGVEIF